MGNSHRSAAAKFLDNNAKGDPPAFRVVDLELGYPRQSKPNYAMGPISFFANAGSTTAIVGPSGSGKSTFLKALLGELQPLSGSIEVQGDGTHVSKTSVVFQENTVFPWLTALANVSYPIRLSGGRKAASRTRAEEWLSRVGLGSSLNKYPSELSGGMLQRVALARALAHEPSLLVLDEPFGQVDELTRMELGILLVNLLSQADVTTFLVTHSIDEALLLSNRVLVLSKSPGRLILDLPVDLGPRSEETLYLEAFSQLRREILLALNSDRQGSS
jgi:NitT/TauT family transport system ATP-binding protein